MDTHYYRVAEWYRQNGDRTYRLNYDLTEDSIVVDAGGYLGDFAAAIFDKYRCNIYIFEPISENCDSIKSRFVGNAKIRVFTCALGDQSRKVRLEVFGDATSSMKTGDNGIIVDEVETSKVLNEIGLKNISLFKINVEGAEYAVIDDICTSGWINHIENIQIQFHNFVPNADQRLSMARKRLIPSHHQTYAFRYVWENWVRTTNASLINSHRNVIAQLDEMGEKIAMLEKQLNDLRDSYNAISGIN